MTLYFAHHASLRDTDDKRAMVAYLTQQTGEDIVDPYDDKHQDVANNLIAQKKDPRNYFNATAGRADRLAFTSYDVTHVDADVAAQVAAYLKTHPDKPKCHELRLVNGQYLLLAVTDLSAYQILSEEDSAVYAKADKQARKAAAA